MEFQTRATVLVLLASLAALAAVFGLQYGWGVEPCPLCVYQRYPYGAAIPLTALALSVGRGRLRRGLMAATGLVFLVGFGLAAYHVGVEQHWWTSPVCGAGVGAAETVAELRRQLLETPPVPCDEVAWSLFGISLAGYNVMASLALAGLSLAAARPRPTGRT